MTEDTFQNDLLAPILDSPIDKGVGSDFANSKSWVRVTVPIWVVKVTEGTGKTLLQVVGDSEEV